MESYSLKAVLSVADNNFVRKMQGATDALSALDVGSKKATSSIMDIAKGVGAFKLLAIATTELKESLSGAIDRFDTMTRFPKVMENMGFSAESSNKSIQKLSDGIQGLPTSLDGITSSTQRIAVLTGNLNKATDTSLALNNAFLASGSTTSEAERGLTQYVQLLSKGTVDMQSWRALQETMGYALSETAKQLGITSGNSQELYDALQGGSIAFDQFNDALIECSTRTGGFADKAKTASAGIKTSFTNLGIAVTRGMTSTIQSVNDAMNKIDGSSIQGKIESASGVVDKFFDGASKGAMVAVQAIDLLGPSVVVAAAGFVTFKAAMAVTDKLSALKVQMAESKTVIDAFRNAELLATQAKIAGEKATRTQELAEKLAAREREASMKAIKSETAAKELSVEATKARSVAEKAAASVTKAKADVDKKAASLEVTKGEAEKSGATASELSAKAEALDAAATKAKENADKDSIGVSVAKSSAEKADALAINAGAAAEAKATSAEEAGNIVKAKGNTLVIVKTAVLGVLSGELSAVGAAQWAWNASMTANPIGTVIVATTALIGIMAGVTKAISKLDTTGQKAIETKNEAVKSSKDLVKSLESSSKAYDDNVSDVKDSAKVNKELADNIATLSEIENKSAQNKAEMKAYVDSLNSSMEGLNLQYDAENDKLSMSTDALMKKVDAYEAQARAQAAQERYIEVMKEQIAVEEEQSALKEKRNAFEKEWQKLNNDGPDAMSKYTEAVNGLSEQETALNDKKKELAQSEEYLKGVMVESQAAQAEATNAGAESQKLSLENLSETQQSVVQSMSDTWQSYAGQATNMFDTLSDESDLSVAEMTANLQKNQQVIGDWANNIATLAERGVDQGLLEQLRQAGPESAGYVNAMVQASDEELQQLSSAFANGGETATAALKTAFDLSEVPQSAMDLITRTQATMNEQIAAADFTSIGRNVGQGFGNGISESAGQAATASTQMATDVENATRDTLQTHSPSAVFQSIGVDTVQGFVLGVQGQSGMLNSVMQSVMTSAGQTAVNAMNTTLTNINNISAISFSQIPTAAKISMGATAQAITSGMNVSNQAVKAGMGNMQNSTNSGMKGMNNAVKNNMRDTLNSVVSGMNQLVRATDSGMRQSQSSVSQGSSAMLSIISSLRSGFYSSGYNASLGLANGINSGAGAAIAAANRVASQVATIMARALKERSPSRVTRKIGAYATEGLALGILDDVQKVKSAAVEVAEAMAPTGGIAERFAYAGGYTPSVAYEYTADVSASYTIIVPVNLEGREVARVTAPFTQDELDRRERRNNRKRGYR